MFLDNWDIWGIFLVAIGCRTVAGLPRNIRILHEAVSRHGQPLDVSMALWNDNQTVMKHNNGHDDGLYIMNDHAMEMKKQVRRVGRLVDQRALTAGKSATVDEPGDFLTHNCLVNKDNRKDMNPPHDEAVQFSDGCELAPDKSDETATGEIEIFQSRGQEQRPKKELQHVQKIRPENPQKLEQSQNLKSLHLLQPQSRSEVSRQTRRQRQVIVEQSRKRLRPLPQSLQHSKQKSAAHLQLEKHLVEQHELWEFFQKICQPRRSGIPSRHRLPSQRKTGRSKQGSNPSAETRQKQVAETNQKKRVEQDLMKSRFSANMMRHHACDCNEKDRSSRPNCGREWVKRLIDDYLEETERWAEHKYDFEGDDEYEQGQGSQPVFELVPVGVRNAMDVVENYILRMKLGSESWARLFFLNAQDVLAPSTRDCYKEKLDRGLVERLADWRLNQLPGRMIVGIRRDRAPREQDVWLVNRMIECEQLSGLHCIGDENVE